MKGVLATLLERHIVCGKGVASLSVADGVGDAQELPVRRVRCTSTPDDEHSTYTSRHVQNSVSGMMVRCTGDGVTCDEVMR